MTERRHFRAVPNIAALHDLRDMRKIALHKIPAPKYDVGSLRLDE
jgi:hypothetical protein